MNWAVIKEPSVLVTAAVYGLLAAIVLQAGILGIWLGVLLLFSLWRYCYSVMRAAAQGRKRIPAPDLDSFNPVSEWSVFWHFILFPGLVLAALPYPAIAAGIAVVAAVSFPASAAIMGLTSDLGRAFSPSAIIGFVQTVGRDYLWLVLADVGILVGAFLLALVIAPTFGLFSLLLSLIIEIWALLASFALIGAVLRAHRLEFEIAGELVPRDEEVLRRQHAEWHMILDLAYASFRSGLLEAGYKALHSLVDDNGDSLEINHWLVENMLEWKEKRYALEVAAKLMPRLLANGDGAGALDLYRRCRRHDRNFRLPRVEAEQLAAHAAAFGHAGLADELSYNRDPA